MWKTNVEFKIAKWFLRWIQHWIYKINLFVRTNLEVDINFKGSVGMGSGRWKENTMSMIINDAIIMKVI